jgi:hypothetical protein
MTPAALHTKNLSTRRNKFSRSSLEPSSAAGFIETVMQPLRSAKEEGKSGIYDKHGLYIIDFFFFARVPLNTVAGGPLEKCVEVKVNVWAA